MNRGRQRIPLRNPGSHEGQNGSYRLSAISCQLRQSAHPCSVSSVFSVASWAVVLDCKTNPDRHKPFMHKWLGVSSLISVIRVISGPMWPYAVLQNEPSFAPRQARGYGGQAPNGSRQQSATATEPSVSVPSVFSVASVASRMPRRLQIAKRIQFLRRPCPAMSYDRFRR